MNREICPTCTHATIVLGYCNGGTWRHCPQCGTATHYDVITPGEDVAVHVPKLVERCREFYRDHGTNLDEFMRPGWRAIAECLTRKDGAE